MWLIVTLCPSSISLPFFLLNPLEYSSILFNPFAVVLFRSREHAICGPQPGYVRAHIESKSHDIYIVIIRNKNLLILNL